MSVTLNRCKVDESQHVVWGKRRRVQTHTMIRVRSEQETLLATRNLDWSHSEAMMEIGDVESLPV